MGSAQASVKAKTDQSKLVGAKPTADKSITPQNKLDLVKTPTPVKPEATTTPDLKTAAPQQSNMDTKPTQPKDPTPVEVPPVATATVPSNVPVVAAPAEPVKELDPMSAVEDALAKIEAAKQESKTILQARIEEINDEIGPLEDERTQLQNAIDQIDGKASSEPRKTRESSGKPRKSGEQRQLDVLQALANLDGTPISATDLKEEMGLEYNYLLVLLKHLKENEFVSSKRQGNRSMLSITAAGKKRLAKGLEG